MFGHSESVRPRSSPNSDKVVEGPFPSTISAALPGDRNAFALPLADQGALKLGERTHDRQNQIGYGGILARKGQVFLHELDPDTSFREELNQLAQIVVDADAFADYGQCAHSLRRTKASIIYKATGNLRAVQILLGHTKIESTVRYLGVDVEDALTLAEGTEI